MYVCMYVCMYVPYRVHRFLLPLLMSGGNFITIFASRALLQTRCLLIITVEHVLLLVMLASYL